MTTTLLDLVKVEEGVGYDIIEDCIANVPELGIFPADYADGDTVSLAVRTKLPDVQFRMANDGISPTKSEYVNLVFKAAYLNSQICVDAQMIDSKKGDTKTKYLLSEERGHIMAAMLKISKEIWYGSATKNSAGFAGIISQMDNNMEIDAKGTSNTTSAFVLGIADERMCVEYANDQTIALDAEYKLETITGVNGKKMQAYTKWLKCSPFFRLGARKSAVRIKNIGTESEKTLTGSMLRQACTMLLDNGIQPTHIFLNSRSLEQYRLSLKTDLLPDPPTPKEFEGVPLVRTTNIINGETV